MNVQRPNSNTGRPNQIAPKVHPTTAGTSPDYCGRIYRPRLGRIFIPGEGWVREMEICQQVREAHAAFFKKRRDREQQLTRAASVEGVGGKTTPQAGLVPAL